MAFTEVQSLDADTTVSIGGRNKKTNKPNPTNAEGYFLGTRMVKSPKAKSGEAAIHFLQTPKGNLGVWGKTDMDRKLKTVTPGTMIRISFDKMVGTPNGDMYKFKVEVDASNTIDVADLTQGSVYANDGEDAETNSEYTASANDYSDEASDDEETDANQAALAEIEAAERKAKVQALLAKGKTGAVAKAR